MARFTQLTASCGLLTIVLLTWPSQAAEKVRVYEMGEADLFVSEFATTDITSDSSVDSPADLLDIDVQVDLFGFDTQAPTYTEGRTGPDSWALDFDAIDDLLTSDPFDPRDFAEDGQEFRTLSQAWVKPNRDGLGRHQVVWGVGTENGGVAIQADGIWELVSGEGPAGSVLSTVSVDYDRWTHLAVFRDENGGTLFVNGAEAATNLGAWTTVGEVVVGGTLDGSLYRGLIDDFNISGFTDTNDTFDPTVDLDVFDATVRVLGDVDLDGDVDEDDYSIWSVNVGFSSESGRGDFNSLQLGDVDLNGRIDYFDFQIIRTEAGGAGIDGDFDGDGLLTGADLDLLCSEVSGGGNAAPFDLTGEGVVDGADVTVLLELAGRLPGDADFDGQVQFSDFIAMADNFGESGTTWSHGDFDCNNEVQFSDFITLADNFGKSAAAGSVSAVPEPASQLLLLSAIGLFCLRRRPVFQVAQP